MGASSRVWRVCVLTALAVLVVILPGRLALTHADDAGPSGGNTIVTVAADTIADLAVAAPRLSDLRTRAPVALPDGLVLWATLSATIAAFLIARWGRTTPDLLPVRLYRSVSATPSRAPPGHLHRR